MLPVYEGLAVYFYRLGFLDLHQIRVIYVEEYFKFLSLRSKFIIGVTAVAAASNLTQILDFRQILSSLRIMQTLLIRRRMQSPFSKKWTLQPYLAVDTFSGKSQSGV